jgi:hypothetical protein
MMSRNSGLSCAPSWPHSELAIAISYLRSPAVLSCVMMSAKESPRVSFEAVIRSVSLICAAVSPRAPACAMPRAIRRLSGEKNRFPGRICNCPYIESAKSLLSSTSFTP